jgi:flagellar biosynthesis protein FlhF
MRLKTFKAPSMAEAMRIIRDELGEDAIIVSTQKGEEGGVRVTAALDIVEDLDPLGDEHHHSPVPADLGDILSEALEQHSVPGRLADRLLRAASGLNTDDPALALAGAMDSQFRFAPLPEGDFRRPFMLVGPPGAGKTLTVAKLATRCVMARRSVRVITTDTVKAGGVEQLSALTSVLKVKLETADNPGDLKRFCAERGKYLQLIDSAGINPFDPAELKELKTLIDAAEADPILVLPGGGDVHEAAEIAEMFRTLGASRLIATRLDLARRLGFMLVAAEIGQFRFSHVSTSARVAEGLAPLNPVSLARLLLSQERGISTPAFGDRVFA